MGDSNDFWLVSVSLKGSLLRDPQKPGVTPKMASYTRI